MINAARIVCVLMAALACAGSQVPAQEEPPPAVDSQYEFVSGTVVELPPGKLVINRAVIGKPPENRTFVISPDTKIEGRLRQKARVTVGFRRGEDGEPVAVRVIVRQQNGRK